MSKKKQTKPPDEPAAEAPEKKTEAPPPPLFEPMSGNEFRFIRKYYGLSQPEIVTPMKVRNRRSIYTLEQMLSLDSANLIRIEKFINNRFGKEEFERVRAIYKATPPKQRDEITKGIKSNRKPVKKKQPAQKSFSII